MLLMKTPKEDRKRVGTHFCFARYIIQNASHENSQIRLVREPSPATLWIPPELGRTKINVDITFIDHERPIGVGFLMRNSTGSFKYAGHLQVMQELQLRQNVEALQHQSEVEVETDFKGAADCLLKRVHQSSTL
ncbi:hypothetical protein FRX31_028982 [Thalictrum thalictroides]|uniref:RNase H type-1 domain-containing protein n=1 Tax=Thalictrum thalictroides TaxID=46969 RepID=A0A7J6VA13_THATH|nr:hypothetical protein FRX31_028982 [Thalictrum thalictroides]